MTQQLTDHLLFLYGEELATKIYPRLVELMARYRQKLKVAPVKPVTYFDEQDCVLITYGDMVQEACTPPLDTLANFLEQTVKGVINTVHLLPFYPYSSDDGFSVIDYKQVDPNLGSWENVARFGRSFELMFDAVVNHISSESHWFQGFLRDESPYKDYFTVVQAGTDLSQVFRPRELPLLTEVETVTGQRQVWTTFSADQIDLNYANPELLLEVVDTLLFYVSLGARFIRLDAIAFIWKEIGTSCIHLPQAHRIIQLLRSVLGEVAPDVVLITETNVPHKDNISYFGDGINEAQMVYNFSLPPLTLHAFHTGDAQTLSRWAATLSQPSEATTFFNFLASHDGIGVTPARDLLSDIEIANMARRVEALGGYVSYRTALDGSKRAYELNINYLDALGDADQTGQDPEIVAMRFIASQAIMLALRGVPGIYFHSLFGSHSWLEGVKQTGRKRSINRQKLQRNRLEAELANSGSLRQRVFSSYCRLLKARAADPAFHPNGDQIVLDLNPAIFAVQRTSPDALSTVFCVQNVSAESLHIRLPVRNSALKELVSGKTHRSDDLRVRPYEVLWLRHSA